MNESERLAFEREFDQKPTRIGGFELLTNEVMGVYVHHGRVDCPIFPPEEGLEVADEIDPFLLQLTPQEAQQLAGLLIYAAGRAGETAEHCITCGDAVEHEHED